ncbi:butyrate kinase [Sporomusa acidovorans]|uniref:Probable butyrate kinase n=1 Tax=Sporomusa acidovorans (strain ATCC 49682 / DSM 3132 / Mol) TaxID=1123286 RepID=A0ABZ3J455_SPOA4|nr:butyrate kinase [Sporomusa acidovorans]OZC20351.1 butyrate kinase 2 [Sporomusa acidovorans DSM 3132]SDD36823.1 butyrate kinase [Sporomusa acidovorans]
MQQYKILAINPGSTSTKIAVYTNEKINFEQVIRHSLDELKPFAKIYDQYDYRLQLVEKALADYHVDMESLAAVVGRGGPLKPLASGTYEVNETMIEDLKRGVQTEHASNLGGILAKGIADQVNIPAFIVDPVSVDELQPLARISGLPDVPRRSLFHALNLKAVAHRVAKDLNKNYDELTLILIHLGSGISVGVQKNGKMIDVTNPNDLGPFSPERAGAVPSYGLINLCFSGKYTIEDIKKKLIGNAGLLAHLGTSNGRDVEDRIAAGDSKAALVYEAMAYQVAKEIGAMATVVNGQVDGIVLTGGLAYSAMLVKMITARIKFIAPVIVYPGEDELKALAEGALRVLRGEEQPKVYK